MKKIQKHTYRFNPHTLRYEKVLVTLRDRVKRISFSVLFGVVLGVVVVVVTLQFMEAPRERALRREVAQYKRQLRVLGDRVERAEVVLSDLEERDDVLYRTIFESEPVSEATRRSGIGGVERYAEFDKMENGALLKQTTMKVDDLTKRLYVESKSLDEVYEMARTKNERLASMPAITLVWPDGSARRCRRMSDSPSGPPSSEPATRPKVAAAIVIEDAPVRPNSSRSGEKPPEVPWPPLIGMDPAAMPNSGDSPSPRAIPTEIRFCTAMSTATRPIIKSSGFPPCLSAFKSDWKPTEVKKSIMHKSFTEPSKEHSTPRAYKRRVSKETSRPPETGAGMQNRFKKGICRVNSIPRSRAHTPMPAL